MFLHHLISKYLSDPDVWKDLIINSIGAFIGIVGAYLLYIHQTKKQNEDKLKYFAQLIESIIPFSKSLSSSCKNLSEDINKDPTQLHLFKFQANGDLKRLVDKLDQEAIFHSLLNVYGRKEETYKLFKNIYSRLDYIDQLLDQLRDFIQKEYLSITEKKKSYVNYVQQVVEKVALLTVDPLLQHEHALIATMNQILVSYHKNRIDNNDLNYPINGILRPSIEFLTKNYPTNSITNEIVVVIQRALAVHSHFMAQAKELAEDLDQYHKAFKDQTELLEEDTKQLIQRFKGGV